MKTFKPSVIQLKEWSTHSKKPISSSIVSRRIMKTFKPSVIQLKKWSTHSKKPISSSIVSRRIMKTFKPSVIQLKKMVNPFEETSECLLHISSGIVATEEVKNDLLLAHSRGQCPNRRILSRQTIKQTINRDTKTKGGGSD